MKSYSIQSTIKITDEEIDNIVDSALEWCGYWCDLLELGEHPTQHVTALSEVITKEGTLKFHIDEPYEHGGKQDFELTLDKLLSALAVYKRYDFEDFDGPMSDAVLQLALFGEVVYG